MLDGSLSLLAVKLVVFEIPMKQVEIAEEVIIQIRDHFAMREKKRELSVLSSIKSFLVGY